MTNRQHRFSANPDYADLPTYSDVRVSTYRLIAGIDYELTQTFNTFFRYNLYDYDDVAMAWNAGTLHMILGGVKAVFEHTQPAHRDGRPSPWPEGGGSKNRSCSSIIHQNA